MSKDDVADRFKLDLHASEVEGYPRGHQKYYFQKRIA